MSRAAASTYRATRSASCAIAKAGGRSSPMFSCSSAPGELSDHVVADPFFEQEGGDFLAGNRQRHVIIDPRNDAERDRGWIAGTATEPCVHRGQPRTQPATDPPCECA